MKAYKEGILQLWRETVQKCTVSLLEASARSCLLMSSSAWPGIGGGVVEAHEVVDASGAGDGEEEAQGTGEEIVGGDGWTAHSER
jgi:hypothetical protein